jgi:cytochrome c553
VKHHFFAGMLFVLPLAAMAQTSGSSAAGLVIWNDFACASCHSLASMRTQIIARAPNAGTLNFSKSLASFNASLTGTDLDGVATGMSGYAGLLSTTQRGDMAAYIAGLAEPVPALTYAPSGGAVFPATLAGSSSSAVVTVTNTGTANLVFTNNNTVTIASGSNAADFRLTSTTCPGVTLQPNQGNCTINLTFQPATGTATTRTATLNIAHNAGISAVPMSGTVGTGSVTTPPVGSGGTTTPPASGGSSPPTGSSPATSTSSANAPLNGGAGSLPMIALGLLAAVAVRRRLR